MTSILGSGRRRHLARAAVALASSLDFLQGTSEKIHLQGLLCQKLLQAMDFLAVSGCVRAGPRRFLSWLNHLQFSAPLIEAPRSYPEFSCQLTDIFKVSMRRQPLVESSGSIAFSSLWFLSRKLCPIFVCQFKGSLQSTAVENHVLEKEKARTGRRWNRTMPLLR